MGGNPGENLILFVFYISLLGLAGAVIVITWIKVTDYLKDKHSKDSPGENDEEIIEESDTGIY